jgi:hypothetical protein
MQWLGAGVTYTQHHKQNITLDWCEIVYPPAACLLLQVVATYKTADKQLQCSQLTVQLPMSLFCQVSAAAVFNV